MILWQLKNILSQKKNLNITRTFLNMHLNITLKQYYRVTTKEDFEETGYPERAMQIYRSAYNMNEVQGLTKDYLLELADRIEDDFIYNHV